MIDDFKMRVISAFAQEQAKRLDADIQLATEWMLAGFHPVDPFTPLTDEERARMRVAIDKCNGAA